MQAAIQFFKDALHHEVRAAAFYNKAAEITRDDESRMLYIKLAGMEEGHTSSLVEKVKTAPCGKAFDVDAFVRELENEAADAISPEHLSLIETGSMRQVLELAIQFENQACQDYENLAREATDFSVKSYCQEAVKEERGHIRELSNLLNSLSMSEEDRPGL
ncbi:MAG: ferritin family protein [Magnetococcales bacterium]|nr:ferritin family protein [Magnetococcales bacterium]